MAEPKPSTLIDTPDPQQNCGALAGRRIVDIQVWAVREGLRRTEPTTLFMGLCQRLADAGVPVWRAFAGARTLHPQWAGYSYTWWRDGGGVEPTQFPRGDYYEQIALPTASLAICGANQRSQAISPQSPCGGG